MMKSSRSAGPAEAVQGEALEDLVLLPPGHPLGHELGHRRGHHEAVADEAGHLEEVAGPAAPRMGLLSGVTS